MSFFKAPADYPGEKPLYDKLKQLFLPSQDIIRAKRMPVSDHVIHSIRNKRTKNGAVVDDYRDSGGKVRLRIFERRAHIAANVGKEQDLVVNQEFDSIDDPEMIGIIYAALTKESDYSKTPFGKIKATKKHLETLNEDEVFVGRIVLMTPLNTPDGMAYDMQFENNSGTLIELQEKVHKITTNPIGQYVVINRQRGTAIIRPQQFLDGYEIFEAENQVTRPADLMP